jgi:hypothetical protein
LEATVLQIGRSIVGLFVIGLFWFWISASPVRAEEVGVNYQILGNQEGISATTTTMILELWNLSGNDLTNLTINLSYILPSVPDPRAISFETLTTTEPRMIMASFTIPNEYPLPDAGPINFYLTYDTADGIPRAAVLQGQPTVFIGNPIP